MSDQKPITWPAIIDYIRSAAGRLRAAEHGASEMLLLGPGDAAANQSAALRRLVEGSRTAGSDLGWALEHIEEYAPPAPPARPLEAVLADIVTEGHERIALRRLAGGAWWCESAQTHEGMPPAPGLPGGEPAAWETWEARTERGDARGSDEVAAAEARLAQIRAQHAAAETHYGHMGTPACGAPEGSPITTRPADVVCAACRTWLTLNRVGQAAPRRHTVNFDASAGTHYVYDNRRGIVVASGFRAQGLAIDKAVELEKLAAEDRRRESEASEGRTGDEVEKLHDAGGEEGA